MKSRLTNKEINWPERVRKMREDYENGSWDYLFFKIRMGIIDAMDTLDYEREQSFRELLDAYKGHRKDIGEIIDRL